MIREIIAVADVSLMRDHAGYWCGGIGIVIYDGQVQQGNVMMESCVTLADPGPNTDGMEYLALLYAARLACTVDAQRLKLVTDNVRAVRQVRCALRYEVARPPVLQLALSRFQSVRVKKGGKEEIRHAHVLARCAARMRTAKTCAIDCDPSNNGV